MTIASMKHLRSIGLPFKNSALRRFLKLGSFRQGNERFEQMIATGCRLEEPCGGGANAGGFAFRIKPRQQQRPARNAQLPWTKLSAVTRKRRKTCGIGPKCPRLQSNNADCFPGA